MSANPSFQQSNETVYCVSSGTKKTLQGVGTLLIFRNRMPDTVMKVVVLD